MLFELGISLSPNESITATKLCSCPVNKDGVGIKSRIKLTSADLVEVASTSAVLHCSVQIFVSVEFAALWSVTSVNIVVICFSCLSCQTHSHWHKTPRLKAQYFHHVFPSDWWPDKRCHCPEVGKSDTKTGNGRLDQPQAYTYGMWRWSFGDPRNFHLWPSSTESFLQGFLCATKRQTCLLDAFGCVNGLVSSGRPARSFP